ncbi:MAG: hypothetical protein EAZ64_04950 [Sphingobacteriales bacterium]|nr:MAG: hypothetical protein EAZ64_04950 [Sphingobacteriales bacterium]
MVGTSVNVAIFCIVSKQYLYNCILIIMTSKIYILLIILFGFVFKPNTVFSCGTKTEKLCCKNENSKKLVRENCFKKEKHHPNQNDDCAGNCSSKSCKCTTPNLGLCFPFLPEMVTKRYAFCNEKQKFEYPQPHLSSGFYTIWTPPNIG